MLCEAILLLLVSANITPSVTTNLHEQYESYVSDLMRLYMVDDVGDASVMFKMYSLAF